MRSHKTTGAVICRWGCTYRRTIKVSHQISKADVHLHITASDGAATVPELLAHVAQSPDLRVIAITDHDSITGARQATQLAPQFGVEVIAGEEVSTADDS
ncbi:MAG: PHP domain-containing protein [Roseiflexaceae bacterium]